MLENKKKSLYNLALYRIVLGVSGKPAEIKNSDSLTLSPDLGNASVGKPIKHNLSPFLIPLFTNLLNKEDYEALPHNSRF